MPKNSNIEFFCYGPVNQNQREKGARADQGLLLIEVRGRNSLYGGYQNRHIIWPAACHHSVYSNLYHRCEALFMLLEC